MKRILLFTLLLATYITAPTYGDLAPLIVVEQELQKIIAKKIEPPAQKPSTGPEAPKQPKMKIVWGDYPYESITTFPSALQSYLDNKFITHKYHRFDDAFDYISPPITQKKVTQAISSKLLVTLSLNQASGEYESYSDSAPETIFTEGSEDYKKLSEAEQKAVQVCNTIIEKVLIPQFEKQIKDDEAREAAKAQVQAPQQKKTQKPHQPKPSQASAVKPEQPHDVTIVLFAEHDLTAPYKDLKDFVKKFTECFNTQQCDGYLYWPPNAGSKKKFIKYIFRNFVIYYYDAKQPKYTQAAANLLNEKIDQDKFFGNPLLDKEETEPYLKELIPLIDILWNRIEFTKKEEAATQDAINAAINTLKTKDWPPDYVKDEILFYPQETHTKPTDLTQLADSLAKQITNSINVHPWEQYKKDKDKLVQHLLENFSLNKATDRNTISNLTGDQAKITYATLTQEGPLYTKFSEKTKAEVATLKLIVDAIWKQLST